MGLLSRESLLSASDLREETIDLPTLGGSVKVRGLAAAYSNQAMSEALEVTTDQKGRQTATVNTRKLEALQVFHGLIEPKLNSVEEAEAFALKCGPAWRDVVSAIDRLSGVDKEAIEKVNATFQSGGPSQGRSLVDNGNTAGTGAGGPDLHVRTGAQIGDAGG